MKQAFYLLLLVLFMGCGSTGDPMLPNDEPLVNGVPIDRASLKDYGEFLTDTNSVYRRYDTSDEVILLELEGADRATFRTFGNSPYARDKNWVYDSRHGRVEAADVETFRPIEISSGGRMAYGKDKNNYFFWNQVVEDTTGFGEILKSK